MKKNTAINLGVWVGLVVLTAFGMTVVNSTSLQTARTMNSTQGSVIGYVPGEEPSYRYMYTVNGRSFQGSAKPRERVEEMKLGGTVTVFYEPENPANSTLSAPQTVVVKRVGLIMSACLVLPILVMWILHARHLLPPWKLVQDCREWVALHLARLKSQVRTKAKTSPIPAERQTASAK